MAISLVLLMAASDFVRTVKNYRNVDVGIRPDQLVLIGVNPGLLRYSGAKMIAYMRQVRHRLASLPGVRSATWSTSAFGSLSWTTQVKIPGFQTSAPMGDAAGRNIVGPRFVETLGFTLLAGRDFDARDTRDAAPTVVINESFARYFFGAENPIGRPVFFIDSLNRPHTVIGVVRDGRDRGIRTAPAPVAYTSYEHDPLGNVTFAVRSGLDPAALLRQVGAVLRDADPLVPVFSPRTMEMLVDESLQRERMMAALSSAFGVVAILVAAVGLYGLLAWAVATRTREIGIRMALGARTRRIVWLAMRDAAIVTGAGILLGVPIYLGFARAIRSQVFGVTPGDPPALLAASVALVAVAALAAFVPAWRAGRVDPMVALRHE
jgi:predicted permease